MGTGRKPAVLVAVAASLLAAMPAAALAAAPLKPGDVLVAASTDHAIDQYRPSTGSFSVFSDNAISTTAGGQADLVFPIGITFDHQGRVLVSDRDSPDGGGVTMINPKTGAQKVVSDNAISTSAGGKAVFGDPGGIAVDSHGTIYVADFGHTPCVIKVDPKTGAARRLSSQNHLSSPSDLALSGGNAFVTDTGRIVRVSLKSGAQHVFVRGHGLGFPGQIVTAPHGNFLVADQTASKLFSINGKTGRVKTVSADSMLSRPYGVGIGLNGFDYAADWGAAALFQVNPKTGKAKPVATGLGNPLGLGIVPH